MSPVNGTIANETFISSTARETQHEISNIAHNSPSAVAKYAYMLTFSMHCWSLTC